MFKTNSIINMKKIILCLIIIHCSLIVANAQWVQCDGIYGGTVNSLVASGNNIFAGGSNGVFILTNNGENWSEINQGFNIIPFESSLMIVNNYIYAGTYRQSVWRRELIEITGN